MYTTSLLLAAASILTLTTAQTTSSVQALTGHVGSETVSSYSAHPPSFTPASVNTATLSVPSFSFAHTYNSSTHATPTNYNSTTAPVVTASNYTTATSTKTAAISLSSVSSAVVATTSTGPTAPVSSTNAASFRRVAGTGLALVVAGSYFAVLL